ncbi:MAG: arylsulfatase [Flavobacteriaceae bacterium]
MFKAFVFMALIGLVYPTDMQAQKNKKKPNILFIFGDDIGMFNISAYHNGLLGGQTPNIDRIASEGAIFMEHYSQQSCTAGRAAFIMGQHPYRTGLLTIGMPGADYGIQDEDPTIAHVMKNQGYTTGQFGKNHLGDLDKFLPTKHGFDYFFGNLYHLNAEEEPEDYFYPKSEAFKKRFGPRGVLKASADGKVEDTGPLTSKRMETIDAEFLDATVEFMDNAVKEDKPFFIWYNSTRMHVFTHLSPEWVHSSSPGGDHPGYGLYADGMTQHDHDIGVLLDELERLGIADNTIVVYSSDNGAEVFSYPDGGMTPFKGEKGSTWEGGFRTPMMVRWPGKIKPGTVVDEITSHEDFFPTLSEAAGEADIVNKMLKGYKSMGRTYNVHLDGYSMMDLWTGEGPSKRHEIFYFDAGGNLNAVRSDDWKAHFSLMTTPMPESIRSSPAWPKLVNLKSDPFERAPFESQMYTRWYGQKMYLFVPFQVKVQQFLSTFNEYPQRQPVGSLSIDKVLQQMEANFAKMRAANAAKK